MGDKSKIEWTDASWNPVAGCSRVSSGCDNCYAMGQAHRIQAMGNTDAYHDTTRKTKRGVDWSGVVNLLPERLDQPLRWKRPRRIFVNSMSDLFHPTVPTSYIAEVFVVMMLANWHTYQILTKRPERMAEVLNDPGWLAETLASACYADNLYEPLRLNTDHGSADRLLTMLRDYPSQVWPADHIWLGTSVENQTTADERIPHLLKCPAVVRWLSCEPLLGSVDLTAHFNNGEPALMGYEEYLHWIVCGGESGPGARPMHPRWARSLRDQCLQANVPFHFKQHGRYIHEDQIWEDPEMRGGNDAYLYFGAKTIDRYINERLGGFEHLFNTGRLHQFEDTSFAFPVGKKVAGRVLDGRTWNQYPQHKETSL